MPIVLLLVALGVIGAAALSYTLTDHAASIPGPPFVLPPLQEGDRAMYVATFAQLTDAAAFFAWAHQAYNGWASMLTPDQARQNNDELLFIQPGVAAWVTFDPGSGDTILASWNVLAMYKYTMAAPLM